MVPSSKSLSGGWNGDSNIQASCDVANAIFARVGSLDVTCGGENSVRERHSTMWLSRTTLSAIHQLLTTSSRKMSRLATQTISPARSALAYANASAYVIHRDSGCCTYLGCLRNSSGTVVVGSTRLCISLIAGLARFRRMQ